MNDNLETMVTDEGNSNQEYLLHGKHIGYLATCLAYNRKELPLHYGRLFTENEDVSYGDGGGTPIAVMTVQRVEEYESKGDEHIEFYFDEKLHLASNTVSREGDVLTIDTVHQLGHARKRFTCTHDLSTTQSIPNSVYEAVGYASKDLPFYHPHAIEFFCASTFSLASECFDYVDFADGQSFYFNAERALTNDFSQSDSWEHLIDALKQIDTP
ncbi:hypothetical protein [Vibrio sp. 10N.222.54.B11]|uniref:hypothetical protein n=1 Tax=Vibrio sp. 10N.222.54.B11 TaxID=3229635 RepID=UPI00354BEE3F